MPDVSIGARRIGAGRPVYVIAEMSANHGHDFDKAARIVEAAKEAGADAVKLQTYTPDTMTIDCASGLFRIGKGTIWEGRTLYDLYGEAYTPWDWQPRLKKVADDLGLDLFSTPFDATAVDFLEAMDVPAHKIASFELVDLPLIRTVAATGKPVIMSTGMADRAEIDEAVAAFRQAGGMQLVLLKCTSAYPAPPEGMNLRTIPHMARTFGTPVGLSDHTLGLEVPVAAVSLGACVIEKHFCLDRSEPGPDSAFSMEPAEFKAMVEAVRNVERALGGVSYETTEREKASRVFRRSLFVVRDVRAGQPLTGDNVRCIRPANGLAPKHLDRVLGATAAVDIERGTPLAWEHLGMDPEEPEQEGGTAGDTRIVGERIYLRDMRDSDVNERYLAWMNDPEIVRYLDVQFSRQTMESLAAFVQAMRESPRDEFMAIVLKDGDRHIGNLRIGEMNVHGVAHMGITIGEKDCWGRGLATEAIRLATRLAFETIGLRKIWAGFYPENKKSIRVYQKAGWEFDTILHDHLILDGKAKDKHILATFNPHWKSNA